MNELLLMVLSYILEFLIISALAAGFLGKLEKNNVWRIAAFILPLSLINSLVEWRLSSETNVLFINLICLWFFIWVCFRKSSLQTLLLSILVFCTTMLIQVLLVLFFAVIRLPESRYMAIIGNSMTLIIAVVIYLTGKTEKIFNYISSRSLPVLIAVINTSAIMLVLNVYHKIYSDKYTQLLSVVVLPIIIIVFMNIVMIREYLEQQKREKQLMTYQNYIPVIEEIIDQIRSRQHKFENEIQTIKSLPKTCTDYQSLCAAMEDYTSYMGEEEIDTKLLGLNYKFLSALLYQKMHYAKANCRKVRLEILAPILYTSFPEYELVDMAGILFDNMIEATSRDASCVFQLDSSDNKIIITTINPGPKITPEMRTAFVSKGYTTKQSAGRKRGYGLYLLFETVKRYDGMLYIENTVINGVCQVVISVKV